MSLDLKDVSLKRNGKWLLRSIDWQVKNQEHWVLYGLNGAGKTALLNMLCSYYFPTSGEMTVLGHVFGKEALGEKLRKKLVSSLLVLKRSCTEMTMHLKLF